MFMRGVVVPGFAGIDLVVPLVRARSASSATIEQRNRLSPLPSLRILRFHGEPLPVPMKSVLVSGSYVIAFHTVPPPPCFQRSPNHVFAAISIALFSKPFAGSPGTV